MTKQELMNAAKNMPLSVIDRTGNCCSTADLVAFLNTNDVTINEIGRQTYLVTPSNDAQTFGLEQSFVVLMPLPNTQPTDLGVRLR